MPGKTAILLWLALDGTVASVPERGTGDRAALDSWARAHWVQLSPPRADPGRRFPHRNDQLSQQIERGLAAARLASDRLDLSAARTKLDSADKLLIAHPELAEAAFQRASVFRLRSEIATRESESAAAARRYAALADALEGSRARGYGRQNPGGARLALERRRLIGPSKGDRVFFDGRAVPGALRVDAAAGIHHLRVLRRGVLVYAGWHELKTEPTLQLAIPGIEACSQSALARVTMAGREVRAPAGVSCGSWVVARRSGPGVLVARCWGRSCTPALPWKAADGGMVTIPAQPREEEGFPAWATWMLIGAGALTTTAIVFWRSGEFEQTPPPRKAWQYNGPTATGFRF